MLKIKIGKGVLNSYEFGVFSADKETVFIRPASIHLFICA